MSKKRSVETPRKPLGNLGKLVSLPLSYGGGHVVVLRGGPVGLEPLLLALRLQGRCPRPLLSGNRGVALDVPQDAHRLLVVPVHLPH